MWTSTIGIGLGIIYVVNGICINKHINYVIIYIMWQQRLCLQADTEEVGGRVSVPDEGDGIAGGEF
jgi:hypothetical protein